MLLGSGSFVLRDYGVFGYPIAHYHRECFWQGELPLWNPLNNCGLPFLAQWNTMTLYPGSLCYLLLPLPWSLGFFMLLHLWLGGLGAYVVARRWTGFNFAAAVAGVAYAFHGLTQQSLMWPNNIAAFGLLPWVVLTVERGVREGGRKLVVAAVVGALQMLTGAPEVIVFTWVIAGALAVFGVQGSKSKVQSRGADECGSDHGAPFPLTPALSPGEREGAGTVEDASSAPLASPAPDPLATKTEADSFVPRRDTILPLPEGEGRGEGEGRACSTIAASFTAEPPAPLITNHFSLCFRLLGIIALVTLLSSAQLLPFLDLLRHSQRDAGFGDSVWSLPAWGFANYLVPLFRCILTSPGVPLHSGQNWTSSYYAGAGVLALALLAVLRVSDRRSRLLSLVGAVCLVLALGEGGFLFSILKKVLPLGVMRYPVKFVIPLTFILPMLAAFALAELFRDTTVRSRRREEAEPVEASASEAVETADILKGGPDTGLKPGANESANESGDSVTRDSEPEAPNADQSLLTSAATVDERRARMARHRLRAIAAVLTAVVVLIAVLGWLNPMADEGLESRLYLLYSSAAGGLFLIFTVAGVLTMRTAESRTRCFLWSLAVVGLIFADLRTHLPSLTPRVPPGFLQPGQPDLQALTPVPRDGVARASLTWQALKEFKSKMLPDLDQTLLLQRVGLYDNLNLLDGIAKTDGIFSLYLREQQEIEARMFLSGPTNSLPGPLADFLGVAHVSSPTNIFKWHRRDTALPLITAGQRPEFAAAEISLPAMASTSWNPAETVFIHPWEKGQVVATNAAVAKVLSAKWAARRIECEVESDTPTLVVIAQAFYHPWRATVNGQPTTILRANHAFQAVAVPSGRSTVRLEYVDRKFQFGVGLSALGLVVCGALWWRSGRMPNAQ